MPARTCPTCNGDGYVNTGDAFGGTTTCSRCMGEGEVYD